MPRITKQLVKDYMDFIGHAPMTYASLAKFVDEHGGGCPATFASDIALTLRGMDGDPLAPQAMYLTVYMLAEGLRSERRIVDSMAEVFRALCIREKIYADDVVIHNPQTGDAVMSVQKAASAWLEQPAS